MGDSKKYKIFVINMPGSDERWANISAQLNRLGAPYERVDGVDARKLGANEISKYYSFEKNRKIFPKPLRIGEIGCYIAHVNCWKKIVNQNIDFGMVLEDDVFLSGNFPDSIKFLYSYFNKWNFVLLHPETKKRLLYTSETYGVGYSLREYIRTSGGFMAYAVKRDIAEKLYKKILPFGCTADTNSHLYYQYKVDVKSLFPPVVFHRGVLSERVLDSRTVAHNFYPFARQVFQIKSYMGKVVYLAKRDGIKVFLKRMINLRQFFPPEPL